MTDQPAEERSDDRTQSGETSPGRNGDALAVDRRVRVIAGPAADSRGRIVEDFGELPQQPVDIGGRHFADPARRWAVLLDDGALAFFDTDQLEPE
ncbi:MAG: hypothetical protein DIU75_018840 [Mycolicibacterium hassiacum]|jgi:hypothetical protein|uniref:hypothetical protein n=1 Tax=Mycolicibacterium hassiacum TaxID=46351 RepID=UPI000DB042A6|nr:hypothetical protein [Mycolicibacterium hassiacum]MBX5486671.1 hypothetical protein [Mycolicibacterium hassiacum]PZN24559.1 MAG: hypothetical protein DIU75_02690 [Mycolicibacterium hassiacum]